MNLLVLVQNYPSEFDPHSLKYVHTRNKYYSDLGINVLVLAFKATKEYVFENISVTNFKSFNRKYDINSFDAIVSHAPNLRNHLKFILFKGKSKKIIFFIHGHEVLRKSKYYPKPYPILTPKFFIIIKMINNVYDYVKLVALRKYFNTNLLTGKIKLIFVSEWMKNEFQNNVQIKTNLLENNSAIIHNGVSSEFLNCNYEYSSQKGNTKIITIRPFDDPKYAVDLVIKAAVDNPHMEFHLFGKGQLFNSIKIPPNLKIIKKYINHQELPLLLNNFTAAFMPTRLDSQGVMMCEMATYGIPLITSNLSICHEMLKDFPNVFYISNNSPKILIEDFIQKISHISKLNKDKFSFENTILAEIKYFHQILYNSEFNCRKN